jgi:hypothetical protein
VTADGDLGADLRETAAHGATDPTVPAGHERDLSVEPEALVE